MSEQHLILVDASGFAHRAFYGRQPVYRKDGLPTWAILGFLEILHHMIQRAEADKPTHGACVFDAPGKTFRHEIYPSYKGNRDPARRKELTPQMPFMRHAGQAFGFEPVELSGYEADDLIATLSHRAMMLGWRTTIVSSDKDFLQCVKDDQIEVVDPMQHKRVLEADVKTKFGCVPALVPDVQALWGDAIDNIPGIKGIGGKGAGKLITRFGSLEGLLDAAGKSGQVVGTPAIRSALRKGAADAKMFKRLATLRTDVPIDVQLTALALQPIERHHLREILRVLEADHKFDVMFTNDPSVTIKLPRVGASLLWWTKSLKTKQPHIDQPQDGFYKRRLVQGGPYVPARIWREKEIDFQTEKPTDMDVVHCEVGGKLKNPLRQWDALSRMPITQAEYEHRMAVGKWASEYDKDSSEANPHKPINWNLEPL